MDLWVIEMNIFSGSRRIAAVGVALWVIGWLIAAVAHETRVHARYDFVVGSGFANFAGFNVYSCPEYSDRESLEIKTEAGNSIRITLCVFKTGANVPEGYRLDNPTFLLQQQSYVNADLETKRKLFKTHVMQNSHYLSANLETKKAIEVRFGVAEREENKEKSETKSFERKTAKAFNPDEYLKNKNSEKSLLDIFGNQTHGPEFKIRKEDEAFLNEKWWSSWRSAYGQGVVIMLCGVIALWIFSIAMGWIIRGFLGIPFGTDSKP